MLLPRVRVLLVVVRFGWPIALAVSTALVVAVHLITNRVNVAQILRWTVFGGTLAVPHLLSGAIWAPISLHLGIDLLDVVAFGIVGRHAVVTTSPPLTRRASATYRVVVESVTWLLFGAYGTDVSSSLDELPAAPAGGASGG